MLRDYMLDEPRSNRHACCICGETAWHKDSDMGEYYCRDCSEDFTDERVRSIEIELERSEAV